MSDAAWAVLAPLSPAAQPGGRPRTIESRAVLNAIFYLLRTGFQWQTAETFHVWQEPDFKCALIGLEQSGIGLTVKKMLLF